MTANVYNLEAAGPFAGATVKLCNILDSTCTQPFAVHTTGAAGDAPLSRGQIPVAAQLYLDVSSPEIDPLLEFLVAPLSLPQVTVPAPAFPAGYNAIGAASAGVTLSTQLGVLYVTAVDCRLAVAPGVASSLDVPDAATGPFYLRNGA
jgi:hypothetical protein